MRDGRSRRLAGFAVSLSWAFSPLAPTACARSAASPPPEPVASATAARVAPALASAAAPTAPSVSSEASRPPAPPPPKLLGGGRKVVASKSGLVVGVEPTATRVGVRVLQQGGNAVDAAVAVALALSVTHPSAGNIGGGGFMLVRPKGGPSQAVDFRETAPARLPRDVFDAMIAKDGIGAASVGVPGTVSGLALAHEHFGKLPWKQLVEPAIQLARDGHRVGAREAKTYAWSWSKLKQDPGARTELGTVAPKAGSRIVRPGLARALERIRERGAAGFYAGETAADIVATLKRQGGTLTLEDLAGYRAKLRAPLAFSYRGLSVETMPPPSAGGVALLQILSLLERLDARRFAAGSVDDLHLFLEASRRAQIDKRFAVVDPDALTSSQLAAKLASFRDTDRLLAKRPVDLARATPSSELHPLYGAAMRELEHTTHFSVVDAGGMAVSCTTTLSAGFGSKVLTRQTGIVLNNAVASFATAGENLPTPGRRTTSSMAPTLVVRDGELAMVLGSPGGDTIPSTIAQVLRHLVDHGMTLDEAVDAPRVHHGFVPDELRYEAARPLEKSVLDELRARGHSISKKRLPMGDANDIVVVDGTAFGYADPREGGLAAAAAPPPDARSPR